MPTALEQLLGRMSGNALLDKKVKIAEDLAVNGPPPPPPVVIPPGAMTQAQFSNYQPLPQAQQDLQRAALVEALRRRANGR